MISELLSRRSLGSLNSLHDQQDPVPNFNDAFTIYGHPKVKDVLKGFEQVQALQLPQYRAAIKLRCVQKRMELHRVDVRDVITVLSAANILGLSEDEIGEADMEPIIADISLLSERNANTTTISCTDLVLTWILQMFDGNYSGQVSVRRFVASIVVICGGRLHDKLKYLYELCAGADGLLDQENFSLLVADLLMIPCSVFEEEAYGHAHFVNNALYDCYNQVTQEREKVSLEEFLIWATSDPHCLSWFFTFHRVMCSEHAVNLTPCSLCHSAPFLGFRYVGLHSYNLHLCQTCAWTGNTDGEWELREFGTLGQCVNIEVEAACGGTSTSYLENGAAALCNYQHNLDTDTDKILSYCKRLDPSSVNQFVCPSLHYLLNNCAGIDDNIEALLGEYDDRATKLQKDYLALCRDLRDINKKERQQREWNKQERLQVWRLRDDLSCRLAVWMLRTTELYVKQETLLQEFSVAVPTKLQNEVGSVESLNKITSRTAELLGNKVRTEEQAVLVLSKLSLIINNVLLQKSMQAESPDNRELPRGPSNPENRELPRDSADSPLMFQNRTSSPDPLAFENKAVSNGFYHSGPMKENHTTNIQTDKHADLKINETDKHADLKINESDVMDEFESAMNDILIQENLTPPIHRKIISLSPIPDKAPPDFLKPPEPGYRCHVTNPESRDICTPVAIGYESSDVTPTLSDVTPTTSPLVTMVTTPTASPLKVAERDTSPHGNHGNPGNNQPPSQDQTIDNLRFVGNRNSERVPTLPHKPDKDETTGEWESDGSWETEEECTINTETSDPPTSLELQKEEEEEEGSSEEEVSEPECDPPDPDTDPEGEAAPVPPPRTLLSPLGERGRRATSLKTKEGDPKKEELRKVIRASSTAHRNKSFTGIPTPTRTPSLTPTTTPSLTPPSRRSSGIPTPGSGSGTPGSGIPTPKPSFTNSPELSAKPGSGTPTSRTPVVRPGSGSGSTGTPGSGSGSAGTPGSGRPGSGQYRELKKPTPVKQQQQQQRQQAPRTGPYIDEGDSDSETTTSSDSSCDERRRKKMGGRARSARFARSRLPAPARNAASFKAKRSGSGSSRPAEQGFFNRLAE